jgi:hypothetical protein
LGDFDKTLYKERSQCGDVHIVRGALHVHWQLFIKELWPLDLAFSLKNTLSSQLPLSCLEDFDETKYKERSHCGDVHIVRGALYNDF